MIKNIKSVDSADNLSQGYGSEVREIGHLCLFEFEEIEYDNLKVIVDIGGRTRTINLHNLENLSIIEAIPDEIKMADGHPNLSLLLEHFTTVATEYLKEMVLHIA